MADRVFTIAIDGPAGAGKSTTGERVAREIDAVFFDTGILYRALTLVAIERGIASTRADELSRLAKRLHVDVLRPSVDDGRQCDVLIDGRDVTWEIRHSDVDHEVSDVSAHPEVRRALLDAQRRIGRSGRVVMVGRDIGTIVMPDADLKVFLRASAEVRAHRRVTQLRAGGVEADYDEVLSEMIRRDQIDTERKASPLRPAPDAIVIDTDHHTLDEVVGRVVSEARSRMAGDRTLAT